MYKHKVQGVAEECLKNNNICSLCGNEDTRVLDVHHKIPQSLGGTDDLSNLMVVCANCHRLLHPAESKPVTTNIKEEIHIQLLSKNNIKSVSDLNFEGLKKTGEPFKKFLKIIGYSDDRIKTLTDKRNRFKIPMRKEKLALYYTFYIGYLYGKRDKDKH